MSIRYIFVFILIIVDIAFDISVNQPDLNSSASWNTSAITIANESVVGQYPTSIFINIQNHIYVNNRQTNQILVWSNDTWTLLNFKNLINSLSIFITEKNYIFVDNGYLNGRVDKWSLNGTYYGPVMYTNSSCTSLFVDLLNNLYCSSVNQHRVFKKLESNSNSTSLSTIAGTGCPGPTANMLDHPSGIFVDRNFNLYVADTDNNRIQCFQVGQTYAKTIVGFDISTFFLLNRPTSVILDGQHYMFIVDSGNHRIIRSTSNGFQCLFGCSGHSGTLSSQLNSPQTIAFDRDGNIFIVDCNNHRIQKFHLIKHSSVGTLLYGVQRNFNTLSLSNGWSQCYNGSYDIGLNTAVLNNILNVCNKGKLMLGCRLKSSSFLSVAAMGLRADVLYNCGMSASCTKVANGVGWYFSTDYSWGFANNTDSVQRSTCDTASTNPDYRLCWHTQANSGGYRCGNVVGLNSDATYERVIYHSN